MIHVYLVEDNPHLLEDMQYCLEAQGFACRGVSDAVGLENLLQEALPDLLVLDWMLPGKSGLTIAGELRERDATDKIGIVFLTARSAIEDRLAGLELADSYLVKPVDYRELGAVLHSVYRRVAEPAPPSTQPAWQLSLGLLLLYSPDGEQIKLSHREAIVLRQLAQAYPSCIGPRPLIEAMEENWLSFEKNRLELLISRLRAKLNLKQDRRANLIRSVRNRGYRLMAQIEQLD